MMDKKVFNFEDYKTYLLDVEKSRRHLQRGYRSRLAEEIGCQNAFISHVLNTGAHFSLEQGFKISNYLSHSPQERKYFLLLIERDRAGSKELEAYFTSQIDELRNDFLNLKGRLGSASVEIPPQAHTIYYSQWYYLAIHIIVTIPRFRNTRAISEALNLPRDLVEKAVLFLISCGLVVQKGSSLVPGPSQVFLEKSSPNTMKNLSNLRIAAIRGLERSREQDMFYSSIVSLSLKDVEILRLHFIQEIEDYVERIKKSPEETLYCFNLDFFKLLEKDL